MDNCHFFDWFEKEESDPLGIDMITSLKIRNKELVEECKKLQSRLSNNINTSSVRNSYASGVGQECEMDTCKQEKKRLEAKIKKLKEKKNVMSYQMIAANNELVKLKTSHVSKFEIESAKIMVLFVGCILAAVFLSLFVKFM